VDIDEDLDRLVTRVVNAFAEQLRQLARPQ